jgi:hypothetical protein
MGTKRADHVSVLLQSGTVLVVGGISQTKVSDDFSSRNDPVVSESICRF